jgi:hypothetical protein
MNYDASIIIEITFRRSLSAARRRSLRIEYLNTKYIASLSHQFFFTPKALNSDIAFNWLNILF